MNPYEKTAEEMKRQAEGPKRFAKAALGVASGAGAIAFAPVLARAAPLLSQYIPEDLAIKGLSKISPKFGQFIKKAQDSGFDFNEVKNFIGEQVGKSQQQQDKNIIEQESPDLFQFMNEQIKSGRKPVEAGAIAQNDKRFSDVIKKLMKSHKTSWSNIIQSIFGEGETSKEQAVRKYNKHKESLREQLVNQVQQSPQAMEQQKSQGSQRNDPLFQALISGDQNEVAKLANVNPKTALNLIHNFNQTQTNQQQRQGHTALMAILQKIQQARGGQ